MAEDSGGVYTSYMRSRLHIGTRIDTELNLHMQTVTLPPLKGHVHGRKSPHKSSVYLSFEMKLEVFKIRGSIPIIAAGIMSYAEESLRSVWIVCSIQHSRKASNRPMEAQNTKILGYERNEGKHGERSSRHG